MAGQEPLGAALGFKKEDPYEFTGTIGTSTVTFKAGIGGIAIRDFGDDIGNIMQKYFGAAAFSKDGVKPSQNPLVSGIEGAANGAAGGKDAISQGIGAAAGALGGVIGAIRNNQGIDLKEKDSMMANALSNLYKEIEEKIRESIGKAKNQTEAYWMRELAEKALSAINGGMAPPAGFMRIESYRERYEEGGKYFHVFGAKTNSLPKIFDEQIAGLDTYMPGRGANRPLNASVKSSPTIADKMTTTNLPPRPIGFTDPRDLEKTNIAA